jgi:hypothetical protein
MENDIIVNTNIKENDTAEESVSSLFEQNNKSQQHKTSNITDKLDLPELDESLIHPVIETVTSSMSTLDNNTTAATTSTTTVEMVTIVVKDFNYCHQEFLKQIKENNLSINPESIMRLLRIAMIIVEQTGQSGSKKKEFVTNLLMEVITNTDSISPEHKREALNMISGNIVSDSIDFLIDASKGKFNINKVEEIAEEVAKSCFTLCLERFSKKK